MHVRSHNSSFNLPLLPIVVTNPSSSSSTSSPRTPRTPSASSNTLFTSNTSNRNSTDSWNSSSTQDELVFDWKPEQLRLLARTLDALPPQLVTPFNGPIPPSNLLDKIARGVAQAKGPIEWPHSLRATRVKLIELSRARAKEEKNQQTNRCSDVDMENSNDSRFPDLTGKSTHKKRPLYKQSSMDFMSNADLKNDEIIADPMQQHERRISKSGFHPYAVPLSRTRLQLASPACSANFSSVGGSTPSSSTLNTLSSFSSANHVLRRTSSNLSTTSASSLSLSNCTDPRVQRVRKSESFYKDIRLAPSTHKENMDSSPLAGVKRAPSFGALAQEARRDRQILVNSEENKDHSAYPSSDEEEKFRTRGAKKLKIKDTCTGNVALPPNTPSPSVSPKKTRVTKVLPITAPPCLSQYKTLPIVSPKSPTPKPKKGRGISNDLAPANLPANTEGKSAVTTKEGVRKPRGVPMSLKRNPSMFGAELPHLASTMSSAGPELCGVGTSTVRMAPEFSPLATRTQMQALPSPKPAPLLLSPALQRPKTLRRVHRVALGRRISFESLQVPGEDADAEGEEEVKSTLNVRRERHSIRPREVAGQLGSAFQLQ
ncbi:hypothetical protein H0H93_001001 [Arthromyces matolae]|nr:hypothetical protein H0H93_001001 [Arthromyces matolae]